MNTPQALNEILDAIDALTDTFTRVAAKDAGLDPRCGFLYIDSDQRYIAVPSSNRRTVDYYGGFEYVEPDAVIELGRWTLYDSLECARVSRALDTAMETGAIGS